jgi:hypothetical protein
LQLLQALDFGEIWDIVPTTANHKLGQKGKSLECRRVDASFTDDEAQASPFTAEEIWSGKLIWDILCMNCRGWALILYFKCANVQSLFH